MALEQLPRGARSEPLREVGDLEQVGVEKNQGLFFPIG